MAVSETHEISDRSLGTTLFAFGADVSSADPQHLDHNHLPVETVEISGSHRLLMVQVACPEGPQRPRRILMMSRVDQLLSLVLPAEQSVSAVHLMAWPSEGAAEPNLHRITSILQRRGGNASPTKYLLVTEDGDIMSVPRRTEDSFNPEDFELVFLVGKWIADNH